MIDAQSSVSGGTGCQPVAAGNLPAAVVPQGLLTPSLAGGPGASRSNQIRPKNISATCHLSLVTCHLSLVTCHLSLVTCHLSLVTCHLPLATCHLPLVTCHLSLATCHLPLVTCHLPLVTCHLPLVTCHLPLVTCHLLRATLIPSPINKLQGRPTRINRFQLKKIMLLFPFPTRDLLGKSGKMGPSQPWKPPQKNLQNPRIQSLRI